MTALMHMNDHILYGDVPKRHKKFMDFYFQHSNLCDPSSFTVNIMVPSTVSAFVIIVVGMIVSSVAGTIIPLVLLGVIGVIGWVLGLYFALSTRKYMITDNLICLCNGSSRHDWSDVSGFSDPWNTYCNATKSYRKNIEKLPEGSFIEDFDFYGTTLDIFHLFKEKYEVSKCVPRNQMYDDFRELQEITQGLKTFSEKCNGILVASNRAQQKEVVNDIQGKVAHLNETASTKLEAFGEIGAGSGAISVGSGDSKVTKKKVETTTQTHTAHAYNASTNEAIEGLLAQIEKDLSIIEGTKWAPRKPIPPRPRKKPKTKRFS